MQPAGAALHPATPLTYEYANRWSARTTWGGNPPPVAGDSVYIPPNITVIMDVSPPELGALVLDGTLKFDMSAPQLDLTAAYILVRVRGAPLPAAGRRVDAGCLQALRQHCWLHMCCCGCKYISTISTPQNGCACCLDHNGRSPVPIIIIMVGHHCQLLQSMCCCRAVASWWASPASPSPAAPPSP